MNTYILYWKDGTKQTIKGNTIGHAFTLAGYGHGAIRAVDFYSTNPNETYLWNPITRIWNRTWSIKK